MFAYTIGTFGTHGADDNLWEYKEWFSATFGLRLNGVELKCQGVVKVLHFDRGQCF